ncbi:hypothetical protein HDU84_003813 [Entophlyctis sp. JEL0112]|nr:hypothetical protein HDU84_003813 [Entophlyctis sp. JEL0112]
MLTILLAFVPAALSLAKLEPADGRLVFGAWLDTSSDAVSGNDSFAAFNRRIGFNAGAFQVWQDLPPTPIVNATNLANHNADGTLRMDVFSEGTDAAVFLTVYPLDMDIVTDDHITALGKQCQEIISTTGRNIFVRLGPEMNGDWFSYGEQPEKFISLWKRAFTIINSIAPTVAMVWSPNYNGPDNKLPYDAYWPGEEYVDWIGISMYWKGSVTDYPWIHNTIAPENFAAQIIDGQPGGEAYSESMYQEYAVKYNKPFMISESAAAFHLGILSSDGTSTPLPVGVGRTQTQMSFWNTFLFNQNFLKQYPLLKMVFCFEMYKVEDNNTENDYRVTSDPDTLQAFAAGLKELDSWGIPLWATSSAPVAIKNSRREHSDQLSSSNQMCLWPSLLWAASALAFLH